MKNVAATVAAACLAGCAIQYTVTPIASATQEIRYDQGVPTMFSAQNQGAIQVSPLGISQEDSRIVFGIAAFNKSDKTANFGVENLTLATAEGTPLQVFTADQLIAEAKEKAAWAAVAVALSGAAAAYAANQNAYSHTNGYVSTPYGAATYHSTTYNPGVAAAGTAVAVGATAYGMVEIKNSLDRTVSGLRGHILQTTTVDPGSSYGGEAVGAALRAKVYPANVMLTVTFNGEKHEFQYAVDKLKK